MDLTPKWLKENERIINLKESKTEALFTFLSCINIRIIIIIIFTLLYFNHIFKNKKAL